MDNHRVLIIGAGLAGLCCARALHQAGVKAQILEASDGVGGRVRTDEVEGFQLDRGFQVLLTAYPECQQVLDYEALRLQPFLPGSLVRFQGRFHRLADPWRQPAAALGSLFSPIGTLPDKLRVAGLRQRSMSGSLDELFERPQTTTLEALRKAGFTDNLIERFFRPFLGGGVFLDPELGTSSRMLEFVFRMFATGDTAIPAGGMGAIPAQIADSLPEGSIRIGARVEAIEGGNLRLAGGEVVPGDTVVIAVEGPEAARLAQEGRPADAEDTHWPQATPGRGTTCFYFDAPEAPIDEPILVLNGDGNGPINNVCVPSRVASEYAPGGRSLVSVSSHRDDASEETIRQQLVDWFGEAAKDWGLLRSYRIPYSLPAAPPEALTPPQRRVRLGPGLYVCGDHRDNPSINGAMVSGRRAAEAVLADLESS